MARRTWTAADERASREMAGLANDVARAAAALTMWEDDDEARRLAMCRLTEAQFRLAAAIVALERARKEAA